MVNPEKPTVVLVAGAWHQAKVYDPVVAILEAREYPVQAVNLLSAGGPTSTTVEEDARHLRKTVLDDLIAQDKEIVLVLHSFAGIPGGESVKGLTRKDRASQGRAGGIISLVYMAAWMFPIGQSVHKLLGDAEGVLIVKDDTISLLDPAGALYNDLDEETTAQCMAELVHQGVSGQYHEVTYEPYHDVRSIYLCCEKDQAIPLALQKMMIDWAGEGNVETRISPTGHSVMLAAPQLVVDVIEDAATSKL